MWAVVETMDGCLFAGCISEEYVCGVDVLRIDVQGVDDIPEFTKLIGIANIAIISPCSEGQAIRVAKLLKRKPYQHSDELG
jgi:hypothetical protein